FEIRLLPVSDGAIRRNRCGRGAPRPTAARLMRTPRRRIRAAAARGHEWPGCGCATEQGNELASSHGHIPRPKITVSLTIAGQSNGEKAFLPCQIDDEVVGLRPHPSHCSTNAISFCVAGATANDPRSWYRLMVRRYDLG